jgi:hypothetical protein
MSSQREGSREAHTAADLRGSAARTVPSLPRRTNNLSLATGDLDAIALYARFGGLEHCSDGLTCSGARSLVA